MANWERETHILAWALTVVLLLAVSLPAEASTFPIRIQGRSQATVTTDQVRLGDVASVSAADINDNEAVIALKRMVIATSPAPGAALTLNATRIIDQLKEQGVDFKSVGYRLPRTIRVERAARPVTEAEISAAIEETLRTEGRDAVIRRLHYKPERYVVPGIAALSAGSLGGAQYGRQAFQITVEVAEANFRSKFDVDVELDEWHEIPVARRALNRGSVVTGPDVVKARLKASAIPKDAALGKDGIIGHALSQDLRTGEVFRRSKLSIPPVIKAGDPVTMVYRSSLIEATARGVALADGVVGDEIRVKNSRSNKVILGRIIEAGLVGVKP